MSTQEAQYKSPDTYYFIENKFPGQDPNTDLNFDNDILYSDIVDDDVDKYSTPYKPEILPAKPTEKRDITTSKPNKGTNYNIYLYFILAIIALMLLWYFYKDKKTDKKTMIDTYANTAELTMLSPDIGMGSRFSGVYQR